MRPICCACGRALQIHVTTAGVVLRCPLHGVQFRYMTRREAERDAHQRANPSDSNAEEMPDKPQPRD